MRLTWFVEFASLLLSLSSLGKCTSCQGDVESCDSACPNGGSTPDPNLKIPKHEKPYFTISRCTVNSFSVSFHITEPINPTCIVYHCQNDSASSAQNEAFHSLKTLSEHECDLNLPPSSGNVTCSFFGCYEVNFEGLPLLLIDETLRCEMWEDDLTPTVSGTTGESNTAEHSVASVHLTSTQEMYSSRVLETPAPTTMNTSSEKVTEGPGSETPKDNKMLILYIISAVLLVMVVTVLVATGLICVYFAKRKHTRKVKEIFIDTCNPKPMSFSTITRFPTFESVFEVLDATCSSSEQCTSIPISPTTNKTKMVGESLPVSVSDHDDSHSSNTEDITSDILFPKHMRHSTSSSSDSSDASPDSSGPTPAHSPCSTNPTTDTCIATTKEPVVFRIPGTCSQTCSGFSTTSSGYISCLDAATVPIDSGQTHIPEPALPFHPEDSESTCVS